MLKGIKQSDKELLPVIQDYGCLFLCFAEVSPLITEWEFTILILLVYTQNGGHH